MKLEFESLDELELIIAAMGYEKTMPALTISSAITPADLTTAVLRQTADPVESLAPGLAELEEAQGNESAPTEQPEQPKRKRRTKAEMEAARAADQASDAGSDTTSAAADTPTLPATQTGNPFEANAASPTTQTILNAPNQQAATLAGIAAMQTQSPFESSAPAGPSETTEAVAQSPVTPGTDANAFIETRSLEILSTQAEPLTAVKHMHLCREFIAKHGQAKYLQGFALAGLPATVGTYKAEQCARHQAALEFLDLS